MINPTRMLRFLVASSVLALAACASVPDAPPVGFNLELPGDPVDSTYQLLYQRADGSIWIAPVPEVDGGPGADVEDGTEYDAGAEDVRLFPAAIAGWSIAANGSPLWSPDGNRVAVSAFLTREEQRRSAVLVADLRSGGGRIVWDSRDGSPFFLGWSPDSRRIAVLASVPDGSLGLDVAGVDDAERVSVAEGSPLYFDWLADGRHLIVHTSGRLEVYDVDAGTSRELGPRPGSFQAPAVDPEGGEIAAVLDDGAGNTVATLDTGGRSVDRLAAPGGASVSWSPLGRYLAVLRYRPGTRLGVLEIVDTTESTRLVASPPNTWLAAAPLTVQQQSERSIAFAMEWQNDGQALLVLAPARRRIPGTFTMQWEYYELENGVWQTRTLFAFVPTATYLQMVLPFFDQYTRFFKRLAPDGRGFVFDAIDQSGRTSVYAYLFEEERIIRVADGILPTWRPATATDS